MKPVALVWACWLLVTTALGCAVAPGEQGSLVTPTATSATPAELSPTPESTDTSTAVLPASPTPLPLTPTRVPAAPSPTATATALSSTQPLSVGLSEYVDVPVGQTIALQGTSLRVTLIEAHGPPSGCFDCPNRATVRVVADGETRDLSYVFSGNMQIDALKKAQRRAAFGYTIVTLSIAEGHATLGVEP